MTSVALAHRHLAEHYAAEGQAETARDHLESANNTMLVPKSGQVSAALAELAEKEGNRCGPHVWTPFSSHPQL